MQALFVKHAEFKDARVNIPGLFTVAKPHVSHDNCKEVFIRGTVPEEAMPEDQTALYENEGEDSGGEGEQ